MAKYELAIFFNNSVRVVKVCLRIPISITLSQNTSEPWTIPIAPRRLLNVSPDRKYEKIFDLRGLEGTFKNGTKRSLAVNMRTNLPSSLPVSIVYDFSPINTEDGVVYASVILLGLYALIIFEVRKISQKCLSVRKSELYL